MGWAWAPILAYAIGMSQFAEGDAGIAETLAIMGGVDGRAFALLSFPPFRALQLAYLANSAFALVPAATALLLAFAFAAPRRLYTDPIAAFLAVSCASLTLGACIAHPGFGSLEWDKFAVTALFLAVFAGHLLSGIRAPVVRRQLAAALVGMQALFVGVPLICLGFDSAPNAGPLSKKAFSKWAPDSGSPPADSRSSQP
jgi:hypothetical protein